MSSTESLSEQPRRDKRICVGPAGGLVQSDPVLQFRPSRSTVDKLDLPAVFHLIITSLENSQ